MAKEDIQKKQTLPSTQRYVDIAEIKEDTLILKDGSIRVVLLVSSVNFSLKSTEEQEAIVSEYISFLNFLDFPIEIVIQSRKLNIDKYLMDIHARQLEQTNELLRIQTAEYVGYIRELVELGEIMSKKFYIVIPFVPGGEKTDNFFARLGQIMSPVGAIRVRDKQFREYQSRVEKRIEKIVGGLSGMGVSAVRLDTQGLIELFYNTYNLEIYNQQKMTDIQNMQIE